MRVLHLTTEFPPVIYGGLGTAVGGWAQASSREGMSVGVLLIEGELVVDDPGRAAGYGAARALGGRASFGEQGEHEVVDQDRITFFQTRWPHAVEAGVRLAREWDPDIVHLHTAMVWPVAEAIQSRMGKPLVYHVHSVDRAEYEIGEEPFPWLVHSGQETAIASADRLIALSRDERDLLTHYYPKVRDRVRVVGNGIDDSVAAAAAARRDRSPDMPLVLYSGRLVERKGILELLAAIPRVLEAAPNARFVLAGGPPPLSGTEVAAQWLTPELDPYLGRIHFTGWLSPSELYGWYRAADVLVVPSRYEPFGMVILEGMLHGLPIVASSVGGPAEILEHGRTGLLFTPRDAVGLAEALIALVRDEGSRRAMGRAGAEEVRCAWTWPVRVASMRRVYEELLPPADISSTNRRGLLAGATSRRPLALANS